MATIGRLTVNTKEIDIEWKIRNFSSLGTKFGEGYRSATFYFANASWFLEMFPNGTTQFDDSEGFISIFIFRESFGRPTSLDCSIGLNNLDGEKYVEGQFTYVFKNKQKGYGFSKFLSRSVLTERKSELYPSDVLTITLHCTVTGTDSSKYANSIIKTAECAQLSKDLSPENILSDEKKCTETRTKCPKCCENFLLEDCSDHKCNTTGTEGDIAAAQCSDSKESLDSKETSSPEKTCTNKSIKCPECSNLIVLDEYYEREYQMTRTESIPIEEDKLLTRDYKKVLFDGKNHDLILKIGDKEFRAHQDILRARSHVFQSMLDHDMKEKKSGVIDMPDCDPQAMELFLAYVYCGKADTLDQSTMLGLYYIADKYDMQGLKDGCCEFIKKSLSITNICDVIQLALNHSDSGLLEYATEYFMENALDIMVTVEWQSFLKNNSTLGNELLIKSFRKVKNVKE